MNDPVVSDSGAKKLWLFRTILGVLLLICLMAGGEILARIFSPKKPVRRSYSHKTVLDSLMGWRPKAYFSEQYEIFSAKNRSKQVQYATGPYGARVWGDTLSEKPRILFVGDSYTQAVEVSNEALYYYKLADQLPDFEVFGVGQAGFGSLQELRLIQEMMPVIQPDIVILQVCDNDFLDNHWELILAATYQVSLARPYLRPSGEIETQDRAKVLSKWEKRSALVAWWYRWKSSQNPPSSAESLIAKRGLDYPLYAESVRITQQLLAEIQAVLGDNVLFLVFNASYFVPQSNDFAQICQQLGIPFSVTPALAVKRFGRDAYARDGFHWNEKGHEIIAETLLPWIRKNNQGIK